MIEVLLRSILINKYEREQTLENLENIDKRLLKVNACS